MATAESTLLESLQIPCLGGIYDCSEGEDKPLVLFSNLLLEMAPSLSGTTSDIPILLSNLHQLRQETLISVQNTTLNSPEELFHELKQLFASRLGDTWPKKILAIDFTTHTQGRNLKGLCKARGVGVEIGFTTSPDFPNANSDSPTFLLELSHGSQIDDSNKSFPSAALLSITGRENVSVEGKSKLEEFALIHKFPMTKRVPLFVDMSNSAGELAFEIISILEAAGADLSKVCLVGLTPSRRRIELLNSILEMTPCLLCFNSFGNILNRPVGPIPPNDEEIVEVLVALKQMNPTFLSTRIILSMNVNMKIKMTRYGGPGMGSMYIDSFSTKFSDSISFPSSTSYSKDLGTWWIQ